jgi:hypothetical protein
MNLQDASGISGSIFALQGIDSKFKIQNSLPDASGIFREHFCFKGEALVATLRYCNARLRRRIPIFNHTGIVLQSAEPFR